MGRQASDNLSSQGMVQLHFSRESQDIKSVPRTVLLSNPLRNMFAPHVRPLRTLILCSILFSPQPLVSTRCPGWRLFWQDMDRPVPTPAAVWRVRRSVCQIALRFRRLPCCDLQRCPAEVWASPKKLKGILKMSFAPTATAVLNYWVRILAALEKKINRQSSTHG